ncbi:hypothetical protein Tco_0402028 [Tanacetum coccineum]
MKLIKLTKSFKKLLESPYDTESEIKVVKSFLTSHISELQDQTMHDSEEIVDIHEDSISDLQLMPNDDLRSISGFDIADSDDTHENEVYLHSKLGDMESSIVQQVSAEIKSSLPALVTNTLKEQLPKELPHVEAQVQKNLQDQLSNLLLKPMYKEFNAFNKFEELTVCFTLERAKQIPLQEHEEIHQTKGQKREEISSRQALFLYIYCGYNSQQINISGCWFKDKITLRRLAAELKVNAKGEKVINRVETEEEFQSSHTKSSRAKNGLNDEAKKAKILEEYNHHISFRDPLPITKISYVVNLNKEATMKITRGDNPLNLIVHPNFTLKNVVASLMAGDSCPGIQKDWEIKRYAAVESKSKIPMGHGPG